MHGKDIINYKKLVIVVCGKKLWRQKIQDSEKFYLCKFNHIKMFKVCKVKVFNVCRVDNNQE